mgnify:FL=1
MGCMVDILDKPLEIQIVEEMGCRGLIDKNSKFYFSYLNTSHMSNFDAFDSLAMELSFSSIPLLGFLNYN